MAIINGNDYDHIDIARGDNSIRHHFKDAQGRVEIKDLEARTSNVDAYLLTKIDRIEREHGDRIFDLADLQSRMQNHIAGHAELLDNISDKVAEHYTDLTKSIDAMDGQKADRNELAGVYAETTKILYDLDELAKVVSMKAPSVAVAGLAARLDEIANDVDCSISTLANKNDVAGVMAALGNALVDIDIELTTKADKNMVAGALREVDRIDLEQRLQSSVISVMQSTDASIQSDLSNKINKPLLPGTPGQTLYLGENDTTLWSDPVTPSEEQIDSAVSEWLDDHPEATTTVADGSITINKLSQDVRGAIEDAASSEKGQVLGDAIASWASAIERDDADIREHIEFYNICRSKLLAYSDCFDGDGIGFLFYTDPHSLSDHLGMQYEDALKHLKMIRRVYENTPAKYVLLGGDWIDTDHPFKEAKLLIGKIPNLVRTEIGERCYLAAGNHDYNTEKSSSNISLDGNFSHEALAKMWYDSDVCYYVISTKDVDCYVFDSGPWDDTSYYHMEEYDRVQSAWFADKLMHNTTPHLYGMIHNILRSDTDGWLDRQIVGLANAFNHRSSYTIESGATYNFSNASGTFHFIIAGHHHDDYYYVRNNIPLIYTTHSRNRLALDCCYADFDHGVLHCIRIGVGDSRNLDIIPTIAD